jgi:hypothetical protein
MAGPRQDQLADPILVHGRLHGARRPSHLGTPTRSSTIPRTPLESCSQGQRAEQGPTKPRRHRTQRKWSRIPKIRTLAPNRLRRHERRAPSLGAREQRSREPGAPREIPSFRGFWLAVSYR